MKIFHSGLLYLGYIFLPPVFCMKALDTGLGPLIASSEDGITDFAVLANDNLAEMPSQFTICSSFSTDAFTTRLFPFQLLHESGDPLINFMIYAAGKTSKSHRMLIKVGNLATSSAVAFTIDFILRWAERRQSTQTSPCCLCNGAGYTLVLPSTVTAIISPLWSTASR